MDLAIKFRKITKFLYPSVLVFFVVVIGLVFFFSIKFLYKNVNKIFILDQKSVDAQLIKIDFDNFNYVMKKLERGLESQKSKLPE